MCRMWWFFSFILVRLDSMCSVSVCWFLVKKILVVLMKKVVLLV